MSSCASNIPENIYDIVIIGGGPAGFTAGLYAARAQMKTILIESMNIMGQATMTDLIENYPGKDEINGFELIASFKKQAVKFGLQTRPGTVTKISSREDNGTKIWQIEDENGITETLSIVVATGARSKKLDVPGEDKFIGSGVSYCATCDGAFFRDKDIIVVGGGDTAVEEAMFLTRFGKKVTIIHRRDRLRATKLVQDRAFSNDKIDFIWDSVIEEIKGEMKVDAIILKNIKTDEMSEIKCDGVFIFVGWHPNTEFLKGMVDLTENGCIKTDSSMKTSCEGIFAAGDCCEKTLYQVVTACGDGATAAFSAQHYAEHIRGTEYV